MRAVLWRLYLNNPIDRTKIADLLNQCVSAAEKNQSMSPRVLLAVMKQADECIDGILDQLKAELS